MKRALPLDVTHPEIIPLWHPTLNSKPASSYTKGSSQFAWWQCDQGHDWEARISAIARGTRCPYCSGRKAIVGVNDIATLHPHLVKDWHPDNTVALNTLRPGSQEIGLWICDQGHEWTTKVRNRVNGAGCLVCAGKLVLPGYNDVATTKPDVAALWDHDNNVYTPFEVTANSDKDVNFKCSNGHTWHQSVHRQSDVASGCSYCAGRKAEVGDNDLATTHPLIAAEWHPTANNELTVHMVTASMDRKVWWLGDCGHEWDMYIYSRTKVGKEQGCPVCSGRRVLVGFNDLESLAPDVAKEWDYEKNDGKTPRMFTRGSNQYAFWKCVKGHEWRAKIADRTVSNSGCPVCSILGGTSRGEQEVFEFLKKNNLNVTQRKRKIIDRLELDMYLPDLNFAIEYNGIYWHTEGKGKDKTYHYNKWLNCKNLGIQLIHIWEDEWVNNEELVKKMLLHKLGVNNDKRIYARKTSVKQIETHEARDFFTINHIQGFASASYYFSLVDDNNAICAVIALKKEPSGYLNIIRYATSSSVIGGFTKLMKYIEKTLVPIGFITFSDNCVSDGKLYENNGFIVDKELDPDYRYVVGMKREHKFGYRLKRFMDDPKLQWEEGLTEKELAQLNGIERIWDAGKVRWVKETV